MTALLEEYGAKSQEAVPALAEKTQEIAARLGQGESFEALMAEYSIDSTHQDVQDPGFLFHPQSENWSEAFRAAAAALEQGPVHQPLRRISFRCNGFGAPFGLARREAGITRPMGSVGDPLDNVLMESTVGLHSRS